MNKEIIDFMQQSLGSYGQYAILASLAGIAFFYVANQFYFLRSLSREQRGKRLGDVRELLDAIDKKKDLLVEEAFYLSYGFALQSRQITYIMTRENQRNLVVDLKSARFLLAYDDVSQGYEYKKRLPLRIRDRVHSIFYWLSAVMVYLTLTFAFWAKVDALMLFAPVFAFLAYASLDQVKCTAAAMRVLDKAQFPLKQAT
jgi:hypothetical protein